MDKDPSGYLSRAAKQRLDETLRRSGKARVAVEVPDDMTGRFDTLALTIDHDEEGQRTVCHIQRPTTDEFQWRSSTFILWDDGRDAGFDINLSMNLEELQTKADVADLGEAIRDELRLLNAQGRVAPHEAAAFLRELGDDIIRMINAIDTAVFDPNRSHDRPSEHMVRKVAQAHRKSRLLLDMQAVLASGSLDETIEKLYETQRLATTARVRLSERYITERDRMMTAIEADGGEPVQAGRVWQVIETLDAIDEI